jgi:hypothetical protein
MPGKKTSAAWLREIGNIGNIGKMDIEIRCVAGKRRTSRSGKVSWKNPHYSWPLLVTGGDKPEQIDGLIEEAIRRLRNQLRQELNVSHYVWTTK